MLDIKEQPVLRGSQAPIEFEIMQELLEKCRGYIRGLGYGPKPPASNSVDFTSPNSESIALSKQIEKQEQELVDLRTRLSQFWCQASHHVFGDNLYYLSHILTFHDNFLCHLILF
ncbi:Uncharacterized protein Adt_23311 [Abeliophyllum distichum]|uniref:Uncharacterized protein n=1 Tax=Abeliophyllum distichum TaxID=126358 RepID=A0ABD1SBC9_9LAMI